MVGTSVAVSRLRRRAFLRGRTSKTMRIPLRTGRVDSRRGRLWLCLGLFAVGRRRGGHPPAVAAQKGAAARLTKEEVVEAERRPVKKSEGS